MPTSWDCCSTCGQVHSCCTCTIRQEKQKTMCDKASTEEFGLTPQQYHAGLDKLWEALGLQGVQCEDVFTLAAKAIKQRNEALRASNLYLKSFMQFSREVDMGKQIEQNEKLLNGEG